MQDVLSLRAIGALLFQSVSSIGGSRLSLLLPPPPLTPPHLCEPSCITLSCM